MGGNEMRTTRIRGCMVLRRSLVSAGVVVAVVGGFAHTASAWRPLLSGETVCSDGDHLVTWSIGNSESGLPMRIVSASAGVGMTPYAVTGYTAVVPGGGWTSATTTTPGGVTGTMVLTLHATWPNGEVATSSASVLLEEDCTPTSTEAPTTTTESSTTTTTVVSPTSVANTPTVPESSTVVTEGTAAATTSSTESPSVTGAGVTTTTAAPNQLPFTGTGGWPPLVGVAALGIGGALSFVFRRFRTSRG